MFFYFFKFHNLKYFFLIKQFKHANISLIHKHNAVGQHAWSPNSLTLISETNSHESHPQIIVMNRSIPLSSRVYKASFSLPP